MSASRRAAMPSSGSASPHQPTSTAHRPKHECVPGAEGLSGYLRAYSTTEPTATAMFQPTVVSSYSPGVHRAVGPPYQVLNQVSLSGSRVSVIGKGITYYRHTHSHLDTTEKRKEKAACALELFCVPGPLCSNDHVGIALDSP